MNDGFNPTLLARKDLDRLKGYRALLDFYHGRQWPKGYSRGEKQLTFNYSKVAIAAGGGFIRVPVNCGQQAYDVISVTDSRASLDGHLWRLLGLVLTYNPGGGQYEQRLYLGAV